MADLSPDTSIYSTIAKSSQGGLGSMDLSSLLSVAGKARELQTQQAVSDALRASGGDPATAKSMLMQPGAPGFVSPDTITSLTHAQQAQSELGKFYTDQIGKAAGALFAKSVSKAGANSDDWHTFSVMASGYGMPASTLAAAEHDIVRPDGSLDRTKLANWWNIVSGGQQLPQQQYQTQVGRTETAPAATFTTGGPAGGGAGGGPGTATVSTPAGALVGAGAGKDYRDDTLAARNFQSDVTPLQHIIAGLQSGTITGRSTEEVNNLKNFLHATGIDAMFGKDLSKDVVPYEELRKYMIRAADMASSGGTNDRLAAAVSGNPNAKLLSASNLDLAKVNLGLRRMQQVGYQEFQNQLSSGATFQGHPLQYEDYSNWYTQWAAKQDSRAFVHDLLNKDQRQKVFDSFKSDDEAKAYRASWQTMHQNHPEIERAGAP